ncbi:MAG: HAD-IC family P-type ATPase, partial [Gallionella sp.]
MAAQQSWWLQPLANQLASLDATVTGLSSGEARTRLLRHGANLMQATTRRHLAVQFLSRFRNPLIVVLLVASAVSAASGEVASFIIIVTMLLTSVTLDFVQEIRAERAAEKLRSAVALKCKVLRDGAIAQVAAEKIVPGDVVVLAAGDLVPADGRVLEARDCFVMQAQLTGEAYPVEKLPGDLPQDADDLPGARNVLFSGTSVISGTAHLLACKTAGDTTLGQISTAVAATPPPGSFDIGVRRFGMLIMRMTFFLVLFVLLVNVWFHRPLLESFLFAVALAVGLTPELLPMVVSVTLARGALRMARLHVMVKRLSTIQNLGGMDVLCTDKTGTLTEARIRLERHIDGLGRDSERVLRLAYLNSYFETGLRSPLDEAILEHENIDVSAWHKIDEVQFDFERRRISVLLDDGKNRMLVVKGAPEDILRLST